jgi:hypothetical protein
MDFVTYFLLHLTEPSFTLDFLLKPHVMYHSRKKKWQIQNNYLRALAADTQQFSLNLGNKITFYFPIKKRFTIDSLIFSYVN